MNRLKNNTKEIVDAMIKKLIKILEVLKLDKIVINMGVGEAKDNAKVLESAVAELKKMDKKLLQLKLRNQSLTSNFVKEWLLDVKLHLEEKECMSSLIV